jgi:phosphoglucosamine mutase
VSASQSLADYTRELTLLPQVLVNVKLSTKPNLQAAPIRDAVAAAEADLAGKGRVLLRPSGTEPVVRVMVEGEDRAHVQELATRIAEVVKTGSAMAV